MFIVDPCARLKIAKMASESNGVAYESADAVTQETPVFTQRDGHLAWDEHLLSMEAMPSASVGFPAGI